MIMKMLEYDLFWSFRSPYSYLAASRLLQMECDYEVRCNVRPVYPIAVRLEGFFKRINPLAVPYFFQDVARIAEFQGVPYAWPNPDPIRMNFETGEVDQDQPLIHRLTRLGVAAAEKGRGLQFVKEVGSVIFGGTVDWHRGNHLAEAAIRAGLDLQALDQEIDERSDYFEASIAANETSQKEAGHWGVPLMVFRGEPFFGQDRVEVLEWRLRQAGLHRRLEAV